MCKRFARVFCGRVRLTALVSALLVGGCSIDVSPGPGGDGDGDGGDGNGLGGDRNSIVVSFRNLADTEAVDVEFYFAEGALENVPEDLFLDENRVQGDNLIQGNGIGLTNTATIGPGEADSFSLTCDQELTFGTTGGVFLDAETGEQRGQGTMIWLQQDAQFFCGAVIEFRYASDGDGFSTSFSLDP